jgi:MoxR-like ATPase
MNADPGMTREAAALAKRARDEMGLRLVGRDELSRGILTGILAGGHVLLEGVPGLAKTLAVRTFADISGLSFSRIQFTPDLLPADITGALIWEQNTGRFLARRGPLFANIVLADEVNRAPAKVQSALLEAMEEGQVTIGEESLRLPEPFFVMATQNPIEHEGTYPLPEAELDRFVLKLLIDYPAENEEEEIVRRSAATRQAPVGKILGPEEIAFLRSSVDAVRLDDAILRYIVRLVRASRPGREQSGQHVKDLSRYVEFGASPRASIHLSRCARIAALLDGRDHVLPDDVKAMARPVLRHRLVMSYQAEADSVSADAVIARLLSSISLP